MYKLKSYTVNVNLKNDYWLPETEYQKTSGPVNASY